MSGEATAWRDYTLDEWAEISAGASFDGVPTHQVGLLHRHWIWANHARRTFESALAKDDRSDPMDFASRTTCAMYVWYGLLYGVIEGLTTRKVRLGGVLVAMSGRSASRSVRLATPRSMSGTTTPIGTCACSRSPRTRRAHTKSR